MGLDNQPLWEPARDSQWLLRDLALSVIMLEDEDANECLLEYIKFVGDMELLGEVTRLTMRAKNK